MYVYMWETNCKESHEKGTGGYKEEDGKITEHMREYWG